MSAMPGILGAIMTMLAAGLGTAALFGHRKVAISELLALSCFLGIAVVSILLWVCGFFLRDLALQVVVSLCCILLGFVGVNRFRRSGEIKTPWTPMSYLEWGLLLLLGMEVILVAYGSFQHTLGWDGLLIWELKARYAFENGGALPISYFTDSTRVYSHPEYPLGLPLTQMWLYLWLGEPDQFWVKLFNPLIYFAGITLLAHGASELAGKRWVGLLLAALFLFLPSVNNAPGGVFVSYADLPLAFFYLGAVVYLLRYMRNGSRPALLTFCVLAATLPWLKRDGMILWGVLSVVGAFIIWRRQNLVTALLSFLPGLCLIIAWSTFLAFARTPSPPDFMPISADALLANVHRLGPILTSLLGETLEISRWSVFWLAIFFSFVWLAWRERSQRAALISTVILLPVGLYCGAYLFSDQADNVRHIQSSLPRLLLHVTPVAWLAIALALRGPQPERTP